MVYLIINWVLSSLSLLVLVNMVPGFRVLDLPPALVATGLVGLISACLGCILRYAPSALSLAMSAAFLLVSDTFLFRISALLVPGFGMRGFLPAIAGALLLLLLNVVLLRLLRTRRAGLDHSLLSS